MKENFTKKELRTGMIVETRNKNKYMVLRDCYNCHDKKVDGAVLSRIVGAPGYLQLSAYNDDLIREDSLREFDIMIVRSSDSPWNIINNLKYILTVPVIWERNTAKDMTLEEVEKVLGYKINLTDEKFKVLEKRLPNYNVFTENCPQFTCPNCGFYVTKYHKREADGDQVDFKNNYCWNCGQALDFSSVDEVIFEEEHSHNE